MNRLLKTINILFSLSLNFAHSDHEHSQDHGSHKHSSNYNNSIEIGKIEGRVINEETSEYIEYVTVSIFESKSNKSVGGAITDKDGDFFLSEVPIGKFFIVFEFIGYEKKTIDNISITQDQMNKHLDVITLVPKAIEGSQITITDDLPVIDFETDKIVLAPNFFSGLTRSYSAKSLINFFSSDS